MAAPEFTAMHLFWSLFLLCSMHFVLIESVGIKADDSKYMDKFEEFMKQHGRMYKSGTAEFKHRYNTFVVSYRPRSSCQVLSVAAAQMRE